jgi:hypothetical protein
MSERWEIGGKYLAKRPGASCRVIPSDFRFLFLFRKQKSEIANVYAAMQAFCFCSSHAKACRARRKKASKPNKTRVLNLSTSKTGEIFCCGRVYFRRARSPPKIAYTFSPPTPISMIRWALAAAPCHV